MQPGFSNLPFEGASVDGENWTATKPILYTSKAGRVFRVPPGSATDGPSVPHWAESGMGRTGPQWLAGVLHDAAYRDTLEVQTEDGQWQMANLSKEQSDELFLEALLAQGVRYGEALLFFGAVKEFGGPAFRQDRANPV